MDWTSALIASLVTLLAFFVTFKTRRPKNIPPGPPVIPFLGNIFSLGKRPAVTMVEWQKRYGDIFSVYGGGKLSVVLSDISTVRKIYAMDTVTGRDTHSAIRPEGAEIPPDAGLILSNHDLWKTHRRFALSTLRDLGMGKNWLEDIIIVEVEAICQILRETNQKPFNPKVRLTNSVSNVICALIFGQRFELTDSKFSRLTGLLTEDASSIQVDPLVQDFPFLMWFPNPIRSLMYRARQNRQALTAWMKDIIAEVGDKNDRNANDVQDYLHAYQREKETGAKTAAGKDTFDEPQLLASLLDLFGAGTESTANTTLWAFLFLLEHPDIQQKVHDEIDNNVGREKPLRNSDRSRLPYTEAFILEVQRLGSMVPFGARDNFEEITIDGYTIPKNTTIVVNLFSVHRDPRWWKSPNAFDPMRFLDENMKLLKPEGFVPFSVGKRACLGEGLAKMELFLFIANLLRCFRIELPPGKTISSEDYISSVVNVPVPFEVIFIPRT